MLKKSVDTAGIRRHAPAAIQRASKRRFSIGERFRPSPAGLKRIYAIASSAAMALRHHYQMVAMTRRSRRVVLRILRNREIRKMPHAVGWPSGRDEH